MTTDIRSLALQLRAWSEPIASGYEVPAAARTLHAAADALEAMASERDKTRADYEAMKAHNKELVERLRGFAARHYNAERVQMASAAADALEAMAGEVARLDRMLDGARGCLKETEAEAARLKAQVEALTREKDEYRNALNRASRWKSRAEIAEAQAAALRAAAGGGE